MRLDPRERLFYPFRMEKGHIRIGLLVALLSVGGCAMQRAQDAETARQKMLGMTREQVFTCMGIPQRKATEGQTEIWSYKSGNNYKESNHISPRMGMRKSHSQDGWSDSISESLGFGSSVEESRSCSVQVVLRNDAVVAVHFSGPTGGVLTADEQCAFATRNCLHADTGQKNGS